MKSILSLLLSLILIIFSCCCCSNPYDTNSEVSINMPDDDTVNGYRTKKYQKYNTVPADSITVIEAKDAAFCANLSTKKFHTTSCSTLKNTQNANKYYSNDRNDLVRKGYTACKKCKP